LPFGGHPQRRKSLFRLTRNHEKAYIEYETEVFVNALGPEGEKFARMLGYETGFIL